MRSASPAPEAASLLSRLASQFRALEDRQFRVLWTGMVATAFGGTTQVFALGWLLVQTAVREEQPERAPLYIGLVGVTRGVPGLVFGLLGGVLADRLDRRLLLVLTRVLGALVALALAVLVLADRAELPLIMGLSALAAVADSMELPLRQSMVGRMLRARDIAGAQALLSTGWQATAIVAPLVAGVLIVPFGTGGLILASAVAYAVATGWQWGLAPAPPAPGEPVSVLRSLGDGLQFVRRDPVLRWVIALSAISSVFVRPLASLMPAVAENTLHVGATELSWLLAGGALGGFSGALVAVLANSFARQGRLLLAFVVLWGALNILFGLQRELAPALAIVALPSICWGTFASLSQVLIQTRTPDHLRGRALSLYGVTISAFMPLGALVVGSLGTLIGVSTALVVGGGVTLVAGLSVLLLSEPMRHAEAAEDH